MTSHPLPAWEEREMRGAAAPWRQALLGVLVPFKAPAASPMSDANALLWWRVVCAVSVLPIAALLHWGLFHHPTCMLNNFGHEYTPAVIWAWLSRDPALPWAVIGMFLVYRIGLNWSALRALIAPGFVAGLLFTLWIWDIPWSGRAVCGHFHDDAFMIAEGVPMRSKHVLGVCAILYTSSMFWVFPRFVGAGRRVAGAAGEASRGGVAPAGVGAAGIPAFATAAYPRVRFNPDMER